MYVVDLARHNDGEEGLVGPFGTRPAAEYFIESLEDKFVQRYATIRPVTFGSGRKRKI